MTGYDGPMGSVYVECTVSRRVALSLIVGGWTRDEAAALAAGDPDARMELIDQAQHLAIRRPDSVDLNVFEMRFDAPVVTEGDQDGSSHPADASPST